MRKLIVDFTYDKIPPKAKELNEIISGHTLTYLEPESIPQTEELRILAKSKN